MVSKKSRNLWRPKKQSNPKPATNTNGVGPEEDSLSVLSDPRKLQKLLRLGFIFEESEDGVFVSAPPTWQHPISRTYETSRLRRYYPTLVPFLNWFLRNAVLPTQR